MTALDGAEGWAYAVSGRVRGTALDDLSGEAVARTLPSLLRALDAAGTSGYGIWTPDGRAPQASWPEALLAIGTETPRVPGWRAALVDSGIGLGPVEAGLSALAALTPCLPDARRLIHGDLLSRNVLAGEAGITGVLDWGNALYGDPLYDAAWLLHWWPWYPGWRPGISTRPCSPTGVPPGRPRPTCGNACTPTCSTSPSTPSPSAPTGAAGTRCAPTSAPC